MESPLLSNRPFHAPKTRMAGETPYFVRNEESATVSTEGLKPTRSTKPLAPMLTFVGNVKSTPPEIFQVFVALPGSKSCTVEPVIFLSSKNSSSDSSVGGEPLTG